jgi:hypothetical protein
MSGNAHEPDAARRILHLLYVIRLTEKCGEDALSEEFLAGYDQALDDMIDAIQCEFGLLNLEERMEE